MAATVAAPQPLSSPARRPLVRHAAPAAAPSALPASVTERLLADSDAIARRMARRLYEEIPLPAAYRDRAYLRLVLNACRDGLRALLRQLHDGRRAHPAELAGLGRAGAVQAEMDVPLEVLLQGYRLAAKVVWREVVDEAVRLGELSPPMVVALSEQVLEYLDGLSGAVGAAYLETREHRLRRMDRERDHLLQRLIAGDASPELRRLAGTAGLDLVPPYRVLAVGVGDGPGDDPRLAAAWRGARAHVAPDAANMRVALVDPKADVRVLQDQAEAALEIRVPLGVGPVAPTLEGIADAARRARDALLIGERLDRGGVHDHAEVGILAPLTADAAAVVAHVERVLGPLLDPRRADLLATLEAVLETRGPAEAAQRLGVHRHTVAYRVGRIHDLLGVDVDDPNIRHRLWLALRLTRLR